MDGWMEGGSDGQKSEKSLAQPESLSFLGRWAEISQPHSFTSSLSPTLMPPSPVMNRKNKYFVAGSMGEDVASGC